VRWLKEQQPAWRSTYGANCMRSTNDRARRAAGRGGIGVLESKLDPNRHPRAVIRDTAPGALSAINASGPASVAPKRMTRRMEQVSRPTSERPRT
jgi:hypothetical protein